MSESYLSTVKTELQSIFDEAFKFTWSEVEKALKQSYKNGVEAGKSGGQKPTKRRNWKRGDSSEDPE